MNKIFKLANKTSIITGASRGIGKQIAIQLAQCGAKVALVYSKSDRDMENVKEELKALGADYLIFKGSVTDKEFVKSMIKDIKNNWGKIDFLVNNAGITKDRPLMLMPEKDWDDVIDVNLKSAYYLSKEVLSSMFSSKSGQIINISSLTAIAGREAQTNYGAAKAGLIGFTKSLAREVGPKGIRVNAIVAGLIDTQMIKKIPKEMMQVALEHIPLRRIGKPEEVAKAVLFLASDMSSYITGSVINVSGGKYM